MFHMSPMLLANMNITKLIILILAPLRDWFPCKLLAHHILVQCRFHHVESTYALESSAHVAYMETHPNSPTKLATTNLYKLQRRYGVSYVNIKFSCQCTLDTCVYWGFHGAKLHQNHEGGFFFFLFYFYFLIIIFWFPPLEQKLEKGTKKPMK